MNPFFKTVIIVTIVILIITLTTVGVLIAYDNNKTEFPPRVDGCPDYWVHASYLKSGDISTDNINMDEIDLDALGDECINIQKLGSCENSYIMDFDQPPYNNDGTKGRNSGACNKYKWAKACHITWDGITNKDNICE